MSVSSPPALALLAGEGLPAFEAISPEQVEQAIPLLLEDLARGFTALETQLGQRLQEAEAAGPPLRWEEVMEPLHLLGERLRWSWGVVSHLNGVCNSPELRQAHAAQQASVVAFGNRCGQSQTLYRALRQLRLQGGWDATQQRILAAELRDRKSTRLNSSHSSVSRMPSSA